MKTQQDKLAKENDELSDHYDFDYAKAKPNRFAQKLNQEAIIVVLEPDVAAAFPTAESINEALRLVIQLSAIPAAKTN
ncbi:MAG: hypothetical protein R6X32_09465 [Chloroflexota bacterium]|jgi:hypothetical protein